MTYLKDFFGLVKQKLFFVLVTGLIFSIVGFGVNYFVNKEQTSQIYNVSFTASNLNDDLINQDNLEYIQTFDDDFSDVDISSLVSGYMYIEEEEGYYTLNVVKGEFSSKSEFSLFAQYLVSDEDINPDNEVTFDTLDGDIIVSTGKNISGYLYLLYFFPLGVLISFVLIFIINKFDPKSFYKFDYNNITTYKYPIKKNFWVSSFKNLKDLKSLIIISLFIALALMAKLIPIPSGFGNLGLSFGYLFLAIICMLYGPVAAFLIGFLNDILGFFLFPTGFGFHFGYVLNACLACFIYGLMFYKTKITFVKVLFSRILINIFVNAILGTIWYGQIATLSDGLYTYFIAVALPKNIVYLIPQSILLFVVIKASMRVLYPLKLVSKEVYDNITII